MTARIGETDMDLQPRGKRALVTGSTAGMGLAAAGSPGIGARQAGR